MTVEPEPSHRRIAALTPKRETLAGVHRTAGGRVLLGELFVEPDIFRSATS